MKKEKLHDALNLLDDDMIESVEVLRKRKRKAEKRDNWLFWMKFVAQAACLCIVIIGILSLGKYAGSTGDVGTDGSPKPNAQISEGTSDDGMGSDAPTASGVVIPKMKVEIKNGSAEIDMMAFFIYQGRSYVQYEWFEEEVNFVGEYLGTATGSIDEWTKPDDYVELSGSISGDFYEVKGFAPAFMLCMKYEDGSVSTYVNDNGITLTTGADLFEERLHLAGNYHAVSYQTREDWYHSTGVTYELDDTGMQVAERFVAALNESPFMLTSDVPLDEDETNIYDREIYHMFFYMDNGMTVQLRLYEGGYVRFQGIMEACVQVNESIFDEMITILEKQ